jgi:hypothetical protein
MAKLTDKQEAFAIAYTLNGGNASKAYRECYNVGENATDGSVWVNAHKALHSTKVSLRVDELRKIKFSKKILSIDERKQLLSEWAIEGDTKSVDLLNKMEGIYIEKVQVEEVEEVKSGMSELYKATNE